MYASVAVIIVNLNGEKYLRDCLNSLSLQSFRDFDVIVVDNGSADNSLSLLENEFPWVKVVALKENAGFAAGNNIGYRNSYSKYVATLNNDTIADSGWLESLYKIAETDEGIGMVASKVLLGREGNQIDSAGMLIYPDGMSRQRGRGEADKGQFAEPEEILFPSACAALYRREMLDNIGFFDEDFFTYCEDADLGLRARISGWKAVLAPDAIVRHLYSRTGGGYSLFKAYHVERNRLWVLLKDLPLFWLLLFPVHTFWRYLIVGYGIISGKGSAARFSERAGALQLALVLVKAYGKGLAGVPRMLMKRKAIWSGKHVSGKEYRILLKKHRISASELMLRD